MLQLLSAVAAGELGPNDPDHHVTEQEAAAEAHHCISELGEDGGGRDNHYRDPATSSEKNPLTPKEVYI